MSVNIFDPHGPFDAPLSYQRRYQDKDLPDAIYGDHDDQTQERLRGAYFQQYSGRAGRPAAAAEGVLLRHDRTDR